MSNIKLRVRFLPSQSKGQCTRDNFICHRSGPGFGSRPVKRYVQISKWYVLNSVHSSSARLHFSINRALIFTCFCFSKCLRFPVRLQDALESGLGKLNLSTNNGPFITQPSFWESEGGGDNPATGAPLLDRNNGFLEPKEQGNQAILERSGRFGISGFKICH